MDNNIKTSNNQNGAADSENIFPLLPLRDIVIFPHMVAPLFVGRAKSVGALADAMDKDKKIFFALQKKMSVDGPGKKDIRPMGTIGKVLQLLRLPDGTVKALVEGKTRAEISQFLENDDFFMVKVDPVIEDEITSPEKEAMIRAVMESFEKYAQHNKKFSKDLINNITAISDPSQLADTVAAHFSFTLEDKQKLLESVSLKKRLPLLIRLINLEIEIYDVDKNIKGNVKKQMEKTQKQYYLNEQLRAIKKEMGADSGHGDDLDEFEKQIKRKKMSKEATLKVKQEFKKLRMMVPMSAEATVVRGYIEWMISLPWYKRTTNLRADLDGAENILDEDHYGLKKPKERIVEYLAVQTLIKKVRGPILCLVGPPGVGKTSLAKSVARATGRKFIRISLGGVRDEAEIRGHRRTYIGAMPGKILQSLKKSGVNNPVFCLDEVDKMSMDFRGDPSAALLEVLDPEQNYSFNDHYLDVDYDLSEILFITTANTLPDIPLPLQDRMEIIYLHGYTEIEKYNIANKFLIKKQIKMNGLKNKDIQFSKNAVYQIIRRYTREAGVRNLEREIASVLRKVASEVVRNEKINIVKISSKSIQKYLGASRYRYGQVEKKDQVGLVTGLAWTHVGGELLSIETLVMPGKGERILTGKLGDVMKESAIAAVSYVRSRAVGLRLEEGFYEKYDIHIHVPEGAIPKDGPSAGIAMCTSIVSALTKRSVDRYVAMTGEITLRGCVLPIGGLKEKIIAAHRGRIKKVIIPKDNKKDLSDIPSNVLKQIEVILVEHMDEVLLHALIVKDGESIFQDDTDIPFALIQENVEQRAPLI